MPFTTANQCSPFVLVAIGEPEVSAWFAIRSLQGSPPEA
jgi:hypothetical protein